MPTSFTRMPNPGNMVTEPGLKNTTALLCIECGWEGTAVATDKPWLVFRTHNCRLVVEHVSTGW